MRAILVIDTAHQTLTLGLLDLDTRARWTYAEEVGNRHGEVLFGALNTLLDDAQVARQDIVAIGFGAGPGSFTGLRIACGVAQGLGWALNVPLVPLNNLAIYASAWAHDVCPSKTTVMVCQDARMGEVYAQAMLVEGTSVTPIGEPSLLKPDQVQSVMPESTSVVLGSAVALFPEIGEGCERVTEALPMADAMLDMTEKAFEAGLVVTPQEAYPLYVRNRVALTIEERERGERL